MPTNVGGRGIATVIGVRRTNWGGESRHIFSSSVSASAATFPIGDGLVRLILNSRKTATAVGARIATPVCALVRNDPVGCVSANHLTVPQHAERMEAVRSTPCAT